MFCVQCGVRLAAGSKFCGACGAPVPGQSPNVAEKPAFQACFACNGSGKVHRSSMDHDHSGCIFCEKCSGCKGKGIIASDALRCVKCKGTGRIHDSMHPHAGGGCFWCEDCGTCGSKGWLSAT